MLKILRLVLISMAFSSLYAASSPGEIPLNTLRLNGWARVLDTGYVRLTGDSSEASSAFAPTPFTMGPQDSFGALFAYQSQQELGQCVADGLAFVAQNTAAGPEYLGEDGSGLGFFTAQVSPAIGVTFDYYQNSITGSAPNTAAIATPNGVDLVTTTPNPPALAGPGAYRYVWVFYANATKTMQVYYSATPTLPAAPILKTVLPVDLSYEFGGQVYFGVTAGTGSCYSHQNLMYFSLNVENVQYFRAP